MRTITLGPNDAIDATAIMAAVLSHAPAGPHRFSYYKDPIQYPVLPGLLPERWAVSATYDTPGLSIEIRQTADEAALERLQEIFTVIDDLPELGAALALALAEAADKPS